MDHINKLKSEIISYNNHHLQFYNLDYVQKYHFIYLYKINSLIYKKLKKIIFYYRFLKLNCFTGYKNFNDLMTYHLKKQFQFENFTGLLNLH